MGLTKEKLDSVLKYDPETGKFKWLASRSGIRGEFAGTKTKRGYISICIEGKKYLAHRLAVLTMTGFMPAKVVDHINQNPSDNRWVNLRDVSQAVNTCNTGRANLLHRGVVYSENLNAYRATLYKNGKYYRKSFAVKKYGEAALDKAIEFRLQMEKIHGF